MHITASVFTNDNENENSLRHDYEVWLEKLAPHAPTSQYRHKRTGEDHQEGRDTYRRNEIEQTHELSASRNLGEVPSHSPMLAREHYLQLLVKWGSPWFYGVKSAG